MKSLAAVFFFLLLLPALLYGQEQKQKMLISSVRADFTQEKHLPFLAKPLISTGEFVFQAPQSLRWEYSTPLQTVLLMRDGQVQKFISHEGSFREEQGMGVDAMQVVLQEISGWLDGDIGDSETFIVTTSQDDRIVLSPKDKSFARFINRIELQLADQNGLMESVTLYEGEGEGSYTRMTFVNSVLNGVISAETFLSP